ncbi:BTAD domain-containing putative transcriptional regulator [Actinosynnema sp. NPDC020468]|uniref:AfsR/SARP family transcriptional regulator n=1 Tax=Actinosynnema sp. NPDC020468 TaxID=3154488 RepID=UPI0033FDFC38
MEIDVLGEVRAVVDGVPVDLGHRRQVCVLAALVVEPGRVVSVERLVYRVWGEEPPPSARRSLASYVTRLRQVVPVDRRAGGYAAEVDPLVVDLHRFRDLVVRARVARDEDAAGLYERALGLWRGEPFTGLDAPWLDKVRHDLAEARFAAGLDLVDVLLRLGRHGGLLPELTARAQRRPMDERVAAQLLRALHADGRTAAALDFYARTREVLADRLGAEPGPALQALHRQLLARSVPRQLPVGPRDFVGREAELAALEEVRDSGVAVVSGIGGVGKTALALFWAHRAASRFPDGVLHADLRGFEPSGRPTRPEVVVRGFLQALDVPAERVPEDLDSVVALYRTVTADRRLLVVLDNAVDSAQVVPLLPGGPRCSVLVTSRNRLGALAATHAVRDVVLDVLEPDEARRMFVARVGGERAAAEPGAAATLLGGCAGLPLAIGIVAARAAAQPRARLAALAQESGLDALDAGEPQAALRTVFSWSYQALDADASVLFGLLGLAPGPDVSLAAAASLAGASVGRTRSALRALEVANLVQQHRPERFRMHDLVRLYAAELAAGRLDAVERLENWYLHSANAAAERLYSYKTRLPVGSTDLPVPVIADELAAMAWFDQERANLLAVVTQGRSRVTARLADVLRGYFWHRMDATGWRATAESGLAAARAWGDGHGEAAALLSLGDLRFKLADHDGALETYTEGLAVAERVEWPHAVAAMRSNLAGVHWQRGRPEQAAEHLRSSLEAYTRLGHVGGRSTALANLGVVLRQLGRLGEARALNEEALALDREHREQASEALTLGEIGQTCRESGEHAEAAAYLERARVMMETTGPRTGLSDVLRNLAAVRLALGDPEEAHRLAEQALTEALDTGDLQHQAHAHNVAATILWHQGDPTAARQRHETALALARTSSCRYPEAEALLGLTTVTGERSYAERALTMARESGYRLVEDRALAALATVDGHPANSSANPPEV